MCGIIGVLANRPAVPLLLESLRRLEYRGYDSAGVALVHDGRLARCRSVGKLDRLDARLAAEPMQGESGIGHTRWATHGAPTEANAHPHQAGPVAVVHNGIIENFRDLRADLRKGGASLESETDTEVVAQLCARHMAHGLSPVDAAAATVRQLQGAFALVFLFEGHPDLLVGARRGSPLAIGYGDGEMYLGSDALALAPFTNRIAYLEEGDWVAMTREAAHVFDADGLPVNRPVRNIPAESAMVDKRGYRHFMAKEIHEQPVVLAQAVAASLTPERDRIATPAAHLHWADAPRVTLVACGTAFYACQVAKYWFEQYARLPTETDIASEFRYRDPPLVPGGIAVFVSQSGETADTLAALRHTKAAGLVTVAVVNVETSSMAREADLVLPILAGTEIGVASTKAFTAQATVLAAMAIEAGRQRGLVDAQTEADLAGALAALPAAMTAALACEDRVSELAQELAGASTILYLGRGVMHPLAMEGALKLKELTYIHAEGYAAGELKHGPIALIDERVPVVALAPHDGLFDKTVSNLQEVMARKGRVALIGDVAALEGQGDEPWRTVAMPTTHPLIAPMVYAVAIQLLAYHTALARGTDVDQPRNLAKSVTVE